jgi:acyl-CoA synthetase (AMP-forming)/AMP-acid ligase II
VELAAEVEKRLGCPVVQGYGLTEASPATHMQPPGGSPAGSIGTVVASTECRLVDPMTGEDAEPDANGEIWIRGPQIMKGYFNAEEATREAIDADGWLHTGDIAKVNGQGNFFIVDRMKELIKYKGFQVAPAELEALLLTHPAVADVAVIPIPDDEAGELPKAFVVAQAEVDDETLMRFVADQVATYKQVRVIEFIGAIPKSPSGKILRRELREREARAR